MNGEITQIHPIEQPEQFSDNTVKMEMHIAANFSLHSIGSEKNVTYPKHPHNAICSLLMGC